MSASLFWPGTKCSFESNHRTVTEEMEPVNKSTEHFQSSVCSIVAKFYDRGGLQNAKPQQEERFWVIIKVPLHSKVLFYLVLTVECLSFTVQNPVCAVFENRKPSSHSRLKEKIVCVLVGNLILRGGAGSVNCDITNTVEANPGPVYSTWKLQSWS